MESLSLFELNNLIRSLLEAELPDTYWLEAELSEAHLASNGHFYVEFVQKDATGRSFLAKARGTMWARTYSMLAPLFEKATGERLRAGMKVRVEVGVVFHELYGYSLNIVNIDPSFTLGDMARRRREILDQLEADGILHDNQQLPLPSLLRRIAVVSSVSAAGYGDFCDQLKNNDYGLAFDVRLFPAVMQGANVEESVLAALAAIADEADQWDCAVIIRGGGATSDLADFDTYSLAAAVAQMPIPVIVGIGHERDETVLDYIAHTRVKTPTAAAAFLIDHGSEQLAIIDELQRRLTQGVRLRVENGVLRIQSWGNRLLQAVRMRVESEKLHAERMEGRLTHGARTSIEQIRLKATGLETRLLQTTQLRLEKEKLNLERLEGRLSTLDPVRLLRRGYTLTFTTDGRLVRSIKDIKKGDPIRTQLPDGIAYSEINKIEESIS
ncbi:MAG: exodeoxyribonuclease VII large subunit [Bacteroidaceae bacterium]|nr:exodeoxyribonuclease VII large subunit [Bacteroidaceae bacterium]